MVEKPKWLLALSLAAAISFPCSISAQTVTFSGSELGQAKTRPDGQLDIRKNGLRLLLRPSEGGTAAPWPLFNGIHIGSGSSVGRYDVTSRLPVTSVSASFFALSDGCITPGFCTQPERISNFVNSKGPTSITYVDKGGTVFDGATITAQGTVPGFPGYRGPGRGAFTYGDGPVSMVSFSHSQDVFNNGFILDGLQVRLAPAPDSLVVITHGWNGAGTSINDPNGNLPSLRNAVQARLSTSIDNGTILPVDFRWMEANSGTAATDYFGALAAADNAGRRLAFQLSDFINSQIATGNAPVNYRPNIHIISHSLGTIVAASAIERLSNIGIKVDQSTFLDYPSLPGQVADSGASPELFYNRMDFGSVTQVENYYGGKLLSSTPAVGAALPGAAPCTAVPVTCEGLQYSDADHTTIHSTFYRDMVLGSEWSSPVLQGWQPAIIWDPRQQAAAQGIEQIRASRFSVLSGKVIEELGVLNLIPNSPVIFEFSFSGRGRLNSLSFNYRMPDGFGSQFRILLDGNLVGWYDDLDMSDGFSSAFLDLRYLGLTSGRFRFEYLPANGLEKLQMTNLSLAFTGQSAVPEPQSWSLLIIGLMSTGIVMRRSSSRKIC